MIKMFCYLMGILEREEKKEITKLSFLNFISPVFDLFSFSVIIYILNVAIQNDKASPKLILFSTAMGVVSLLKGLFELYKCNIQNRFTNYGAQKISVKIYELFQKEELMEHNKKSPMQALTMIRDDTTSCIGIITNCMSLWINSVTMAGYLLILIYVSRLLGAAICAGMLGFMAVMYQQNRIRMKTYGEERRKYTIKSNAQVTTAFGAFKEARIDGRARVMLDKYDETSKKSAQIQSDYAYKTHIISVLMQNSVMTVLFFVLAVVLGVGIHLSELLAPFVICITLVLRMLPMAVGIVNGMINVEYAHRSYDSVKNSLERYEIMKAEEEKEERKRKKNITFQKGLSIKNLTFGYNEKKKIFDGASIEIPAGKSIAIIGVSGAGKTTFLDLILGLLKPEKGSILYDDYDIVTGCDEDGECCANVGDIVSYIPQTVFLNGETVKNNVAFFEEEMNVDENRVKECLQHAQIWEEVSQMPRGIETVIGENGATISGGQRQRIALARALYKEFEILIMDEATAALDMETEKAVIDSIRQVKENKTLLMVTHHRSLANECDLLYKIENQKIIRVR